MVTEVPLAQRLTSEARYDGQLPADLIAHCAEHVGAYDVDFTAAKFDEEGKRHEYTNHRTAATTDVAIERLARRNPREAALAVLEEQRAARALDGAESGWTQTFANEMRETPQLKIADLAARLGVSREHASRKLKASLGASPAALRGELRFRLAADLLAGGHRPAHVAASAGYADQSHMARDIRARAGRTPKTFRRAGPSARLAGSHLFKTFAREDGS